MAKALESLVTVKVPVPSDARESGRLLHLLLFTKNGVVTVPLPASGAVVIGRGRDCDIQVEDVTISRQHARLWTGTRIQLEDLGSANGSRVRGATATPLQPEELSPGEMLQLGSVPMVVQRGPAPTATAGAGRAAAETVVEDSVMKRVYALVDRVADSDLTVLIVGETGVGKELVAAAVHRGSRRRARPFLQINCAALSDSLLESELFGHEKGAFTGATNTKAGLLESAAGGTVFLDEVGELPLRMQASLLRVLESHKVLRVGGVRPVDVDVRFLSATNRDLKANVEQGTFRRDLYFRLNGICVAVPPLRERPSELEPLSRFFAAQAASGRGHAPPGISAQAMDALRRHTWPGNVRELRNAMARAVLLSGTGPILPEHLPDEVTSPVAAPFTAARTQDPAVAPLRVELDSYERDRIIQALEACKGNQTRAAQALGISRRTLVSRLGEYNIPRPRK